MSSIKVPIKDSFTSNINKEELEDKIKYFSKKTREENMLQIVKILQEGAYDQFKYENEKSEILKNDTEFFDV